MTKFKFLLEAVHSRWGKVKLMVVKENHGEKDGEPLDGYSFYYPSGNYMGSLDSSAGGYVGHPNEEVNNFIRFYNLNTLEMDDAAYVEMEHIIIKAIQERDPGYFEEPFNLPDDIKAPPILKHGSAWRGDMQLNFVLQKQPDGCWRLVSHDSRVLGYGFNWDTNNAGNFLSVASFERDLRKAGFTNIVFEKE